jgi:hypothetical protein
MKNLSNLCMIFLIAVGLVIVPIISMNTVNSVKAQNQNQTSTPNSQNDTMATITDNPQTTTANQTTIPQQSKPQLLSIKRLTL